MHKHKHKHISHLGLSWIKSPVIANAPMSGAATSRLAVAVTLAGGLGQIGFTGDPLLLDQELSAARHKLQHIDMPHDKDGQQLLPVGVGIIVFGTIMEQFISVITLHKPAVVWLSFGAGPEFERWTMAIRQGSPQTKIWVQIGDVRSALAAVRNCQADALVLQGSDAGGHGHRNGASIVSLIPEVMDSLQGNASCTPVIAAGGIMDGRGMAAAMALGASGVVMGTRFLGAEEAELPLDFRGAILEASDGGLATARSRVFDSMWGVNSWPEMYDGRCLINPFYQDVADGMSLEEARLKLHQKGKYKGGRGVRTRDIMSVWAGTGVGMVHDIENAATIVERTRNEAQKILVSMGRIDYAD